MKNQQTKKAVTQGDSRKHFPAEVVFGFDRIRIWIDRSDFDVQGLCDHFGGIKCVVGEMHYRPRWKLMLDLLQPTVDGLQILAEKLGSVISVLINYVEIACDVTSICSLTPRVLRDDFLRAAHMRYQRHPVQCFDSCWYYGRRSDNTGKRPRILALYSDKPSKLNNARPSENSAPCCHWECRVNGAPELEQLGVVSLTDLINFNHQHFWDHTLRFYCMPQKVVLGRLLAMSAGETVDVSGTALRNRANRWIESHSIDGKFVMHNALLKDRWLVRQLEEITFSEWLRDSLEAVMAE